MKQILLAVLILLLSGCLFESYDDCILNHVSKAPSDIAANESKLACINKYEKELPKDAIKNISAKGKINSYRWGGDSFSGEIINKNENWIITELKIELYPNGIYHEADTYFHKVYLFPFDKGSFYISTYGKIEQKDDFLWEIVSVKGIIRNIN